MQKNKEALRALASMLGDGRFITLPQIEIEMGCSKPVASKRLRMLLAHDDLKVKTMRIRAGKRGPEALAYALVKDRAYKSMMKQLAS